MTSPAEHAATVDSLRQRVVNGWRDPRPNMIEVVGALDEICALAARADELERQLADARVLIDVEWPNQVEQLERERDEWERAHQSLAADHYFARAERAEAALREIAALDGGYPDDYCAIARTALGEQPQ